MSYDFTVDNPDLTGLPNDIRDRLTFIEDLIQTSHAVGQHHDACACKDPNCAILARHLAYGSTPSTEEVLAWLIAKGHLDLAAIDHATRVGKGWNVSTAPGNLGADVAAVAELVLTERHSSSSFVQRKLGLGFKRAEDCLDVLTAWNILGPAQGSHARAIHVPANQTDAVLAAIKAVRCG